MTTNLASDPAFSDVHILLTALITAAVTLIAAIWRLGHAAWIDICGITVAAGGSVFLWRVSANMAALNADGLPGFSANDWLAAVLTYVLVSLYGAVRPPPDRHRFEQVRGLAVVASLAVNVITI
jgi:hypothetical protein